MTDPNQQPVTPPQQPAAPAYSQPAAPAAPAAPAYDQAYAGAYASTPGEKWNVLAIVSLVTAFFISLAAVITGHIALSQIKKTGEKGRGLAIAGVILGYLGLLSGLIAIIAMFAIAAAGGVAYSTY